jgi:hypothetical protein
MEKVPCAFCNKTLLVKPCRIRDSKTGRFFCDNACAAKLTRNRLGVGKKWFCLECSKPVDRNNKFCSVEHRNDFKYKEYIKLWLEGKISGGSGEGAVSSFVRTLLFQRANDQCEGKLDDGSRCGWSRVNSVTKRIPLTVNHKDGNSENHRPENLELLCPSCHALTPNFGSLNIGNGRKKRREKIQNKNMGS